MSEHGRPWGTVRTGDVVSDHGKLRKDALDEVLIADPKHVHIEVMSDTHIWCGIECADGTRLMLNFYSVGGRAHIGYSCEPDEEGSEFWSTEGVSE